MTKQAKAKPITRNDAVLIATSVRDGFLMADSERKMKVLSLRTDEQRVMDAFEAGTLELKRKLNQHVGRYSVKDGERELVFKAELV